MLNRGINKPINCAQILNLTGKITNYQVVSGVLLILLMINTIIIEGTI